MSYIGAEPDGMGKAQRFTYTSASGGETVVSVDDNSVPIGYTSGQVSVFLNGVKLVVGTDCIATNGSTITGLAALAASDVVEVVALSIFSATTVEGADIISTGETGGSKFLREDGDGTSSWQTAGVAGISSTGATSSDTVTLAGHLTVNGTTTTINSTTLTVDDKNIEMGSIASPTDLTADGGGITLKGTTDKTIIWENDTDSWNFNQNIETSTTTKVKQKGAFMQSSTHQALTLGG